MIFIFLPLYNLSDQSSSYSSCHGDSINTNIKDVIYHSLTHIPYRHMSRCKLMRNSYHDEAGRASMSNFNLQSKHNVPRIHV